MQTIWHTKTISEILEKLGVSENGLDRDIALEHLKEYGYNSLPEGKTDSLFTIFLRQFKSPLIYILFAASIMVFLMGQIVDGTMILVVLFFNAIVGLVQEGRAQNTLLALRKFVETKATVVRDGKEIIISDKEVVPGDIIILSEGETIPADARIISSNSLKIDESAMTGESIPVEKNTQTLSNPNLTTGDQKNMVFRGTNIVVGNGKAIVVETGTQTVIGRIAKQVSTINTDVPLKASIEHMSKFVIIIAVSMSFVLFWFGLIIGKTPTEMFTVVVALAVSIVPEGLPIVVTLILASGVWRMSKKNALVKKLQAVEALGQARVIAVDKTGTITKNELIIQKLFVNNKMFEITGLGYEPHGGARLDGKRAYPINEPSLMLAGKIASYCSSARVMYSEDDNKWRIAGDPTDAAMLVMAQKFGIQKNELEESMPILSDITFDYKSKYHAVIYGDEQKQFLAIVGAPEVILNMSTKIWHEGLDKKLDFKEKEILETQIREMSKQGLRVIAFAEASNISKDFNIENLKDLTFVGLYGMKDTLRPEVFGATQRANMAGIRVIMITGDHKITAQAIAKEAGIFKSDDMVITGEEMDAMSEDELIEKLDKISVFARVNPNHKLRIIKAFRAKGEIIAMTGDGVNDAPSLVAADLGVAMGGIGTEVAKEAADIILLDDNFDSIVSAVEEGRSIYRSIRKVIVYLFSTSLGEILVIAGSLIIGLPLPLLAAQILWLNFVTDGLMDVSLAMSPKDEGLLDSGAERSKKQLVDGEMMKRMFIMATPMAIGTLFLFSINYQADITKAWTISLTLLAMFQWLNAWNCRSDKKSFFEINPFSNMFLVYSTIAAIAVHMFVIYNPFMQRFLKTAALSVSDWLIIVAVAMTIVLVEEIRKYLHQRKGLQIVLV